MYLFFPDIGLYFTYWIVFQILDCVFSNFLQFVAQQVALGFGQYLALLQSAHFVFCISFILMRRKEPLDGIWHSCWHIQAICHLLLLESRRILQLGEHFKNSKMQGEEGKKNLGQLQYSTHIDIFYVDFCPLQIYFKSIWQPNRRIQPTIQYFDWVNVVSKSIFYSDQHSLVKKCNYAARSLRRSGIVIRPKNICDL